jgi:putative hydrolase of the HAD superfamily
MIFFDIDETLLNQRHAEAAAAGRFLKTFGPLLPDYFTVPAFCLRWRLLREEHLPPFLSGAISFQEHRRRRIRELFIDGASLTDRQADERFNVFLHEYRRAWRLFDDVLECLEALRGKPLGVLSNGNSEQQRQKLRQTGIAERFSSIIISEDLGIAKPGREFFLAACRLTGFAPQECIYVGDRLDSDARGSRGAGMRGIWLDRWRCEAPADVDVIHSLAELPSRLGEVRTNGHSVRQAAIA